MERRPRPLELCGPLVTGVGSLPFLDAAEAVDLVARRCPSLPFWPQLPRRGPAELMVGQAQEALRRGGALTPDSAAGFFAFAEAVGAGRFPDALALKGQLVGPITLCRSAPGLSLEEALRGLSAHARWQVDALARYGLPVMLWVDEPCLGPDTSAGELSALDTLLSELRRAGAHAGLHCCGAFHRGELTPDLISFDDTRGDHVFLGAGGEGILPAPGWIAWGLLDATQDPRGAEPAELARRWIARTQAAHPEVAQRSIFTASCGLGTVEPAWVDPSFAALAAISAAVCACGG